MDQLFLCDACKSAASRILQWRTPKMREGECRRFLAASEDLQQLGERLGLSIPESERFRR